MRNLKSMVQPIFAQVLNIIDNIGTVHKKSRPKSRIDYSGKKPKPVAQSTAYPVQKLATHDCRLKEKCENEANVSGKDFPSIFASGQRQWSFHSRNIAYST